MEQEYKKILLSGMESIDLPITDNKIEKLLAYHQ